MSTLSIYAGAVLALLTIANAAPAADKVTNLPGLNFQLNFDHYSGYLAANPKRQYHYWFTMGQNPTANTPVILWLNGGPGCSSLGGLIEENGPFHIMDNGNTVFENPFAWNKVGHVLYLESPAGVGYSYATDGKIDTNDDKTAQDNHDALVDFFTNKFPELKNNDFYITGESYGGVYIPTLAVLVANDKTNFPNFKGVAIGNGILHDRLNYNTMPPLFYYHGIMPQGLWDRVAKTCCNNNTYSCDYYSLLTGGGSCRSLVNQQLDQADDLDPYNIYAVCYLDGGKKSKREVIRNFLLRDAVKTGKSRTMGAALPLCAQETNTVTYLNKPEVRTALHIPSNVGTWSDCNDLLNEFFYTRVYDDMSPQFKTLIQKGVKILVYNGDTDTVCNVIMNERFVDQLGLTVQSGLNRHPWHYNGSLEQMEQCCDYISNVAGYYTKYTGLDFLTVRGSGHFVPGDKPREAIQMIYNFINGRDYSSPVPFSTKPQPLTGGK